MNAVDRFRKKVAGYLGDAARVLNPDKADHRASPVDFVDEPAEVRIELPTGDREARNLSLLETAQWLDRLADRPEGPGWHAEVRDAVRQAVRALSGHLEAVMEGGGLHEEIASEEPRLIHEVEKLETDLSRALVEAWDARSADPAGNREFIDQLRELAVDVRKVGSEEFALVHEQMRSTEGGGD